MKLKIAILAGDGLGPEVTREAQTILTVVAEAGGHEFVFTEAQIGGVAITAQGTPLPQATIDACLDSDAVLLGAVGDNKFNALTPDKRDTVLPFIRAWAESARGLSGATVFSGFESINEFAKAGDAATR